MPYFKVSPELSDGVSYEVLDSISDVYERLILWSREVPGHGERITIEAITMTRSEFEALPEL